MAVSLRESETTPVGIYTKGWKCLLAGFLLIICMELSFIILYQQILVFGDKKHRTAWTKMPTLLSKYSNLISMPTLDSKGRNTNVSTGKVILVPSFHKMWKINCTKILKGNKEEIQRSVQMLNVWRQDPKLPPDPFMPPDSEVRTWTKDCDLFKKVRNYQRQSLSVEEADFPLAYIIVVHKGSAQVERLLRAIYQPQNIYCIHPDQKSPDDFKSAVKGLADCFDNVFVASRTANVQYTGYTRLLADINCMRDLIGPRASGYPWKYVINLCGQDFPLKSNLEIVRKLKSYNGHNDISGYEPPAGKGYHTAFRYEDVPGGLRRTSERKKPAPHGIELKTGLAYYIATRDLVNYVLKNQTAQDFLEWTNDTYSPDETFWASLQQAAGTPGGQYEPPGGSVVRFIRWYGRSSIMPRCRGRMIRMICVFSMGYVQHLTKSKHIFANKFDYAFDPIALQCSEEAVEFRTQHPVRRAPPTVGLTN